MINLGSEKELNRSERVDVMFFKDKGAEETGHWGRMDLASLVA